MKNEKSQNFGRADQIDGLYKVLVLFLSEKKIKKL